LHISRNGGIAAGISSMIIIERNEEAGRGRKRKRPGD